MTKKSRKTAIAPNATLHERQTYHEYVDEKRDRLKHPLRVYEPLPFQERFHACPARECICQKGNRSGGSVSGFVEDARAVLGMDPYHKYPDSGTLVCIGYGESHVGTIIWPHLFEPGMGGNFRIIQDQRTGEWHPFRPWEPDRAINGKYGDWGRDSEAELSPPLIPEKFFVEEPAWDSKKERIFKIVRIKTPNGEWEIRAYNSNGDWRHAQGFNAHLVHFDEDIANEGWYDEMVARTAVPAGLIRWTAKPADENDAMASMVERAEEQAEWEKPRTVCITATPDDNPYYSDKQKEDDQRHWLALGQDKYEQRYLGRFTTSRLLMYPTFSKRIHDVAREDCPATKIHEALKKTNWYPLEDWCCYATIDPGWAVCAVLFWAVPPQKLWTHEEGHAVIFDELYMRQCDAHRFGVEFEQKARGRWWQDFIIDAHGAALRDLGSGLTPREQYAAELKKRGVSSAKSKHGFRDGVDDPESREFIMREWLRIREDGTTRLMIVGERVPNFIWEMEKFRHKVSRAGGVLTIHDQGERKRNTHSVECGEYGVSHGLPYAKPKPRTPRESTWDRIMASRKRGRMKRRQSSENKSFTFGARGA